MAVNSNAARTVRRKRYHRSPKDSRLYAAGQACTSAGTDGKALHHMVNEVVTTPSTRPWQAPGDQIGITIHP